MKCEVLHFSFKTKRFRRCPFKFTTYKIISLTSWGFLSALTIIAIVGSVQVSFIKNECDYQNIPETTNEILVFWGKMFHCAIWEEHSLNARMTGDFELDSPAVNIKLTTSCFCLLKFGINNTCPRSAGLSYKSVILQHLWTQIVSAFRERGVNN